MNTAELTEELQRWRSKGALGVFSSDQLPPKIRPGEGLVVNTAPSGTHGQHWLALFRAPDALEVFDTYGQPLDTYPLVKQHLLSSSSSGEKIRRNIGQLQPDESDSCGLYCLLFLILRFSGGATMAEIITRIFGSDLELNDCVALYWLTSQLGAAPANLKNVLSTQKCNKQ